MIISVNLGEKSYDVRIARGVLAQVGQVVGSGRRVCVVTDSGVPTAYAQRVADSLTANGCHVLLHTIPQGEENKSMDSYMALQRTLLEGGLSRRDAVVAVGGGVVGDLAGFAAATYMRGIDFYNVPTTILSQVDSSVGGKTAVDFGGYKNMIGAFHQPRAVLIDPQVLLTLPVRQLANGLAEALKMGLTSDAELFALFEGEPLFPLDAPAIGEDALPRLETIIARAVAVKRNVVEQDERETGLRRVLNFGHTLGHAVESCVGLGEWYHGECVAIGMPPMCGEQIRPRVVAALRNLGLPTDLPNGLSEVALLAAVQHDKKAGKGTVCAVRCDAVGTFAFEDVTPEELVSRLI